MPEQLKDNQAILEQLGFERNLGALSDPLQSELGAVVSLGTCTAAFVSPKG